MKCNFRCNNQLDPLLSSRGQLSLGCRVALVYSAISWSTDPGHVGLRDDFLARSMDCYWCSRCVYHCTPFHKGIPQQIPSDIATNQNRVAVASDYSQRTNDLALPLGILHRHLSKILHSLTNSKAGNSRNALPDDDKVEMRPSDLCQSDLQWTLLP